MQFPSKNLRKTIKKTDGPGDKFCSVSGRLVDKLRELAHILLRGYPQPKNKNLSPTVLKRLPYPFHMLPSLKRHNYCLFFIRTC